MKVFQFVVAFVVALLCVATSSPAQTTEGRILGTVRDSSGGVVVGAKVTVTNTENQISRELVTNDVGEFVASSMEPGMYVITAEARGFKKTQSDRVPLDVARDVRVDLQLVPGAVSEVVQVKEQATMTDTTNSTLNSVLENQAINELPLNGRDFQNLLPLHPGVQRTPGGGFHSVTSNGNRPDDNNFFIDGADENDVYYGETVVNEAGIAGTPASILPLDSIQEFNVQESPQADYGVKPGLVMNLDLKSGTNDIHGTAYYFGRNAAVDARNYFDINGTPQAALILHQFGASIGGPIKKDKWFYFGNYEGIRFKVGNTNLVDSPITISIADNPALLAKLAPTGFAPADVSIVDALNGCSPNCNPLSELLSTGGPNGTGLFLPNPGFTTTTNDPALINFNFNNTDRSDNAVVKSDFYINSRNVLSGRFIYSNTNLIEEDANPLRPEWLSTTAPHTQVFGLNWAWTPNSRWVNQVRFSYSRFYEAIQPIDHNVNPMSYGLNTGVTDPREFGFPRINPGSNEFNYMGGNSNWPLWTTPTQTENISDTASLTLGKHTLRFGGEFRYGHVNYFRATEGRGRVYFSSLEDFVSGNPHSWERLYGDPARDVNLKSFGMFVQDDYRITQNVTVNLGLRYDLTLPIVDSRNLLANFVPSEGVVQVGNGISSPYPTNYNNVSPRLGVAWDIFGSGKTVIRAGGGLIFEQPSIRTFMFSGGGLNLNPTAPNLGVPPGNGTISAFLNSSTNTNLLNWNTTGPTIFPATADTTCIASDPSQANNPGNPCSIFGVSQKLTTPFVANWNVNIQQMLGPTILLQVAYVANKGVNLYSVTDLNQPDPALSTPCLSTPTGSYFSCEQSARPYTAPCPPPIGFGIGTGPCYPTLGTITFLGNKASSDYNSLQVTLTKRYSRGLYLLAGYTYAHAIDTATSNLASVPQNSLNYSAERGNGDYDIRNRFTLAVTYDLPSVEGKWQMLKGWQVTTIATAEGGEPFALFDSFNDFSTTGEFVDRWNIAGNPRDVKSSPTTSIPYFSGESNPACVAQASTPELLASLDTVGCFVQGSAVITPPAQGTFGNMGRNIFRGPKFVDWDASLAKTWKLTERLNLQIRAEVFNILNHPNFDVFSMNTDLSSPGSLGITRFTPDLGTASNPVLGTGGSRHIQLGAKFVW